MEKKENRSNCEDLVFDISINAKYSGLNPNDGEVIYTLHRSELQLDDLKQLVSRLDLISANVASELFDTEGEGQ